MTESELLRIKEKVEVLNGERKGAAARAALRRSDLTKVAAPGAGRAQAASASVTAAQYNALLEDVEELRQAFTALLRAIK